MLKEDLLKCAKRIQPYVHNTPVLTSRLLNEMTGVSLYFKCENFQKMGAFKMRGATNAILCLDSTAQAKGVVTHSSGNFAQALSLAAKNLGVSAYIVMPSTAPQVKKDAVRGYGGHIVECEPNLEAREQAALKITEETGATFVHPSNDLDVIIGQGTACLELLNDYPDLDVVFTPVGGGGLVAGSALSAHYFGQDCRVIGGEPFAVDDAYRSMQSGKIESNESANTMADGLKTQLGDINFPIILEHVDSIVRVEEDEIVSAMRLIWERLKIVVEPSSAVAFAALRKQTQHLQGKRVGVILSGGNVDLSKLPF